MISPSNPFLIDEDYLALHHVLHSGRIAEGDVVAEFEPAVAGQSNEFKGAQVEAHDPLTGERVPLFHPRRQQWREHFCWTEDGSEILGLTPVGRAAVATLNMNHVVLVEARRRWARVGWHPPQEDM